MLGTKLASIKNLADSMEVKACGERRMEGKLLNHVDMGKKLKNVDFKRGAKVAGGRGYYLKGAGVLLNAALINFGLAFLRKRNFVVVDTPYLMREGIMSKCAQLAQFDEELYKLNLPYQVVSIGSGALNGAAAKKYDLEGWFPSSKTYRELVSCSNCLDYQARRLGIEYGQKKVSFT
ncbi:hypothetical protein KSP40_PGU002625 [Platanthera guangdongensis]|uniref:Aminoacyl-tRNA synthetase class II (G/ P/ S/T) domain-containing protein n=1 Tax=Platanthera guangdongensis TaxID=2320717 RepID=A0ABR2N2X7_9ASPA